MVGAFDILAEIGEREMKRNTFLLICCLCLCACSLNNEIHVHEWKLHESIDTSTCTTDGVIRCVYACECGAIEEFEYHSKAKGHNWEDIVLKEPTCSAPGIQETVCSLCQEKTLKELEPLNHSYEMEIVTESNCQSVGVKRYVCIYCGETKQIVDSDTGEHVYSEVLTIEPTCTVEGYNYRICTVCGEIKKLNIIPSKGHDYRGTILDEPSCEKSGSRELTCNVCFYHYTETIAPLGHEYDSYYRSTSDYGVFYPLCSVCNKRNTIDVLDLSNYNLLEGTDISNMRVLWEKNRQSAYVSHFDFSIPASQIEGFSGISSLILHFSLLDISRVGLPCNIEVISQSIEDYYDTTSSPCYLELLAEKDNQTKLIYSGYITKNNYGHLETADIWKTLEDFMEYETMLIKLTFDQHLIVSAVLDLSVMWSIIDDACGILNYLQE